MNGNSDIQKTIEHFIDAVKGRAPPDRLRHYLGESKPRHIVDWTDDNGLDLLHHCIILNSSESVEFLLSHRYFNESHQPKYNPYLHLAAKLGLRTILGVILTHRQNDNRPMTNLIYPDVMNRNDKNLCIKLENQSKVSPLDVAALNKHMDCVHQILNICVLKKNPEHNNSGYIALATLDGSAKALQYLLEHKYQSDDVREAIEIAVRCARASCLDLLLETKVKTRDLFEGKNPFHMLYTFSSGKEFGRGGYASLPAVTTVLVKHKFDVCVKDPTNTYPLYSLLSNSLCMHDSINTQYYIECVRILLEAGANANFDECKYEQTMNSKGKKSLVGRRSFLSAMHCLLETVETYSEFLESASLAVKFVLECGEALLSHAAKTNKNARSSKHRNSVLGPILHQYAKTSVAIGVDETVFRFLLRYGADANYKSNDKYIINTYLDGLLDKLGQIAPYIRQPDHANDVEIMLKMCKYMSRKSIKDALRLFKNRHYRPIEQTAKYITMAQKELERQSNTIQPLKHLAAKSVWEICDRNASSVHKLTVSSELKTCILPIVNW
ncbi:uncharacterized protein LOC134728166 [Mytilus trossulus]|uniref:uncharacterized protein LOC134728166 n=1 Tax=Mytilus trossulus TaxID=6551 RepID=UPI00300598B8